LPRARRRSGRSSTADLDRAREQPLVLVGLELQVVVEELRRQIGAQAVTRRDE